MSRKGPRWVPRLVVEAIHVDQVREHGGLIGVRDENGLESALARAQQRWTYEPDADLARLAADYAFGISSNHPFRDGNKRVAFVTAVTFLGLNGLDFEATNEDVVATMLSLASGKLTEEDLAEWIRTRTKKRPRR
ncbi:MAG: type II toxin-antitoxin system death-on-curing family toxin [Vicinamibacterales bacterium]